jgi:PAS domain S-box-containing protein
MMPILGLKDTLLQLLLVIFPAFLMGFGTGKADLQQEEAFNRRLVWLCAISMLLCIQFSFSLEKFYVFDMRIVPIAIGVLYGSYRSALLLTVFYFGIRYLLLGGGTALLVFVILHALFIPALFLNKKRFSEASTTGKMVIAILLQLLGAGMEVLGILYRKSLMPMDLSLEFYMFLAVFILFKLVAVGLIVQLIEGYRDRQRLYQELREVSGKYRQEAHKLQQLIDASPVTIVAIDEHHLVTTINDAMLQYFPGFTKEDFIGKPYRYLTDNYGMDVNEMFTMRAMKGESFRSQVQQYGERTFVTSAFPIFREDGKVVGAVGVSMEMTELIRLRQQISNMERLSLVGQMAASITHEIRNPMAVVRGFVQLMQEKGLVKNEEYTRVIMDELDRANGIIDDFLSLAQNRVVEMRETNLHTVIEQLSPLLLAEANLRGHTIHYEYHPSLSMLSLNEKEMKQLLLNLVRNGMEAMEEKGILTIQTRESADEVELRIADTGRGMAEEVRAKLFEPFFTTKPRGTGLGLAVCLSIVERHEAKIVVESKEGVGTTFIIRFPKKKAKALTAG